MADDVQATPVAEQLRRWSHVTGRAQQLMLEFWTREGGGARPMPGSSDPGAMIDEWAASAKALFADPERLARMQAEYFSRAAELWQGFATGQPTALAAAADKDKRFRSDAWHAPGFDMLRQMYLLTAQFVLETAQGGEGLDAAQRQKMLFHTRQFVNAMSPSNFLALNPDALKAFSDTGGESLLSGIEHMLADLSSGKMTMVDTTAFEVGRNIAATPGSVVFENALFQLIQYNPVTPTVFATPLLIMPPWINKFYILDLTPEKSFIRWAVEQGITVFVVSWRNPGRDFAHATIETYVHDGYITAIDEVLARTGQPSTHMIGYCVAGTTLAVTLGYLAANGGVEKVESATFFTAQVDFEDAGELKVFVDDPQLKVIEEMTADTGYLDGRYMATTFNMLRSNDLVWNYVVNNYMLGKDYMAFDLLYWNQDATNVPAKWHASYLKDYYRDNKLATPGGIVVDGTPIDLAAIPTPAYVQAGREDHIAPARSVYKIKEHWTAPLRFILAGSGHIAGVVNPPSANKYGYKTAETLPATLEDFDAAATEHKGSWWPDWLAWLTPRSGDQVAARDPGPGIEPAPGRYVREVPV